MSNSAIQNNITYGCDHLVYYDIDKSTTPDTFDYTPIPGIGISVSGNQANSAVTSFPDVTALTSPKYIYWGVHNGYMNGLSDGTFRPDNALTRKGLCLVLWKYADKPNITITNAFSDISSCTTNEKIAISWAYENGYVLGYDDGTFRPNNAMNRGNTCVVFYRMNGKPNVTIDENLFTDISGCSTGVKKAICWAYNARLIQGNNDGSFNPNNNCTRKNFITILYKYHLAFPNS